MEDRDLLIDMSNKIDIIYERLFVTMDNKKNSIVVEVNDNTKFRKIWGKFMWVFITAVIATVIRVWAGV
jgi:hypothetical protein